MRKKRESVWSSKWAYYRTVCHLAHSLSQFSLLRNLKPLSQYLLAILPAYSPYGQHKPNNCHLTSILTPSFMPPTYPLSHCLLLHPSKEESLRLICPNPSLHRILLVECIVSLLMVRPSNYSLQRRFCFSMHSKPSCPPRNLPHSTSSA